eukprot:tig00020572_g11546.t1
MPGDGCGSAVDSAPSASSAAPGSQPCPPAGDAGASVAAAAAVFGSLSISDDASYAGKLARFELWLKENGVDYLTAGVEPHVYPGMGMGLRATRPIAKDELLSVIPSKLFIRDRPDAPPASTLDAGRRLALLVLREDANPESFWRPYLDLLPRSYTLPVFFSDEDIELLVCPLRQAATRKSRDMLLKVYEEAKAELETLPPSHSTFDAFKWALATVWCRQVALHGAARRIRDNAEARDPASAEAPGPEEKEKQPAVESCALVPLFDFCNHHPTDENLFAFDAEKDHFFVRASRDIAQGDQVFIRYVPSLDNWQLLKSYGFVIPDSPSDRVKVKAEEALLEPMRRELGLGEDDRARREALLRDKGLLKGLAIGGDGAANFRLKRALCVVSLRRQEGEGEEVWAARLRLVAEGKMGVKPDVAQRIVARRQAAAAAAAAAKASAAAGAAASAAGATADSKDARAS